MIEVVTEFASKLNIPVAKALSLGDDFIVLLDYCESSKAHSCRNLFRVSADGALVWTIAAGNDVVTNIAWREGNLIAWTWGGVMITIDESTGTVLDSVFTK